MNLFVVINLLKIFFEIDKNIIDRNILDNSIIVIRYLLEISRDGYKKYVSKNKKI